MMVAVRNFRIEYDHCTVKQTRGNILNCVVKVPNSLWVSFAIPYIAIRIMEDTGTRDSWNVIIYCWLNEWMNEWMNVP